MTAKIIHVVAGVLANARGEILLAQRPAGGHLAGYWEFPGGKVEAGEAVVAALQRELREEIGVDVTAAQPLLQVRHRYPEKTVLLDVWRVTAFVGEPRGCEQQPLTWCSLQALGEYTLPPADLPVIAALRLPTHYAITPEPGEDIPAFLSGVEKIFASGVRLMQLRAKNVTSEQRVHVAREVVAIAREYDAQVLINSDVAAALASGAAGVHLTSTQLMTLSARPLPAQLWVGASCHDAASLLRAQEIGADFAVLSPVQATTSHPGAAPLGWQRFAELVREANMPVYALGGLTIADASQARERGGQGVAGISAFWKND